MYKQHKNRKTIANRENYQRKTKKRNREKKKITEGRLGYKDQVTKIDIYFKKRPE